MVRNVKKIIIPLFITVIALISVTFATSSNFNIDKIDFFNNSKMSKIYEKLEEEYRIKEPTLLATKNETEIINVSVQAISVLFGSPNQTIDNGYFTFTSKVETFAEYGYDNSDLPKDKNGNVQELYRSYELDEDDIGNQFNYELNQFLQLKPISYSKMEIASITTIDSIKYEVIVKLLDFVHYVKDSKTGELIEEKGILTIELDMLKSENRLSVLSFNFQDLIVLDNYKNQNSNIQSDGFVYDNSANVDLSSIEIQYLKDLYDNYYKSILYLSEVNQNNVSISNSIGFCWTEGIIIANWTWFENYLLSGNELLISDYNNNIYEIDGIVTISKYHDFVVLKLTEKVDLTADIKLSSASKNVVALTSNKGISIVPKIGNVIKNENNIASINLRIDDSSVGAPVLNISEYGISLFGFIKSTSLNSPITEASNISNELYEFYKKTRDIKFEDIKVYKLNDLLNDMYFDTLNSIKFKDLGHYNKKIYRNYFNDLDLKEIYLDSIASIETYDNNVIVKIFYNEENIISKKQYINLLATKLIEQGYQEIGSNYYKTRFKNEKYNITITYESGYIVIVGMEN